MNGKGHDKFLYKHEQKSKELLDYIHTDVWDPGKDTSNGGSKYFITFFRIILYMLRFTSLSIRMRYLTFSSS